MTRFNIILMFVLVFLALALVTSQHRARQAFQALEAEQERGRELEIEYGQLELELTALATSARVDKIARERLKMQLPQTVYKVSDPVGEKAVDAVSEQGRKQP